MFRVRGDTVEVWPAYWKDTAIRVEFFGDEIDRISEINVVTGSPIRRLQNIPIWPATHYVTPKEKMDAAIQEIYQEMEQRVALFESEGPRRSSRDAVADSRSRSISSLTEESFSIKVSVWGI